MSGPLGLESILRFGKYEGLSIGAIIRFDAGYISWCKQNLDWFSINEEARQAFAKEISKDRRASLSRQDAWCWGFGAGAKSALERETHRKIKIEHDERRKAGMTLSVDRHTGSSKWELASVNRAEENGRG